MTNTNKQSNDPIKKFKVGRDNARKLGLSVTVNKERIDHVQATLNDNYPGFYFLNASEKIDFMFYLLEGLMVASCQYGDFRTIDQIAADELIKPEPAAG